MTDQTDYRKFLESEFKHIRTELLYIKEQTTKTNSRVSHVEDEIVSLKLADANHVINCPISSRVDKIDDDLMEVRVAKKYPKLTILIVAIAIIVTLIGSIETIKSLKLLENRVDLINNEVLSSPSFRGNHYDPFAKDSIE
jgi:hypothetical protein